MNVFIQKGYKEWLKELILSNSNIYGFQSKLAVVMGCQRSYLSQVLNGKAHLTEDQLLGATKFAALEAGETEFVLSLYHHDKAGTKELRFYYQDKIKRARAESLDVTKRIKKKAVDQKELSLFYSNWLYTAVYTTIMMKDYRTAAQVASKLKVGTPLEIGRAHV